MTFVGNKCYCDLVWAGIYFFFKPFLVSVFSNFVNVVSDNLVLR